MCIQILTKSEKAKIDELSNKLTIAKEIQLKANSNILPDFDITDEDKEAKLRLDRMYDQYGGHGA